MLHLTLGCGCSVRHAKDIPIDIPLNNKIKGLLTNLFKIFPETIIGFAQSGLTGAGQGMARGIYKLFTALKQEKAEQLGEIRLTREEYSQIMETLMHEIENFYQFDFAAWAWIRNDCKAIKRETTSMPPTSQVSARLLELEDEMKKYLESEWTNLAEDRAHIDPRILEGLTLAYPYLLSREAKRQIARIAGLREHGAKSIAYSVMKELDRFYNEEIKQFPHLRKYVGVFSLS